MKLIIAILLLAIGAFAQNTTYKDGTDCKCDSVVSEYYKSGEVVREYAFIGASYNTCVGYYKNGSLMFISKEIDGNSVTREYYSNGNIESERIHKKYKLDGTQKWYFENGKLAGTATYKNGKLVGYKKCTDGRVGNENLDCLN